MSFYFFQKFSSLLLNHSGGPCLFVNKFKCLFKSCHSSCGTQHSSCMPYSIMNFNVKISIYIKKIYIFLIHILIASKKTLYSYNCSFSTFYSISSHSKLKAEYFPFALYDLNCSLLHKVFQIMLM